PRRARRARPPAPTARRAAGAACRRRRRRRRRRRASSWRRRTSGGGGGAPRDPPAPPGARRAPPAAAAGRPPPQMARTRAGGRGCGRCGPESSRPWAALLEWWGGRWLVLLQQLVGPARALLVLGVVGLAALARHVQLRLGDPQELLHDRRPPLRARRATRRRD